MLCPASLFRDSTYDGHRTGPTSFVDGALVIGLLIGSNFSFDPLGDGLRRRRRRRVMAGWPVRPGGWSKPTVEPSVS